jgi:hypothetical protein
MVKFSGGLTDVNSKPLTGVVGVTFSLYKDSQGGAPLWVETQNVQADKNGHYSAMLGSTSSQGLPRDLFVSGEARWLGVQAQGQAEQARTLLMSVPYALKAADAETLGGKPLSAFQLAPQSNNGSTSKTGSAQKTQPAAEQPNEIRCAGSASCKTGSVPLFASNGGSAKVSDSIIRQSSGALTIAGSENVFTSNTGTAAIQATNTGTSGGFANGIRGDTYSGAASGVAGVNHSSDPNATGIYGYSNSYGIIGSSPVVGVRGSSSGTTGAGIGVQGVASSTVSGSAGVYGQLVSPSSWGSGILPNGVGVWGDTGQSNGQTVPAPYAGVLGTAGDAPAGLFFNNSPSNWVPNATIAAYSYDSNGWLFYAYNVSNGAECNIDPAAHLHCDGGIGAMVQLDTGKRKVAMSAIESPENWFEDFGSAQLVNGIAVIRLDRDFTQTVNTEKDYRVFPVPNGDCKGLYVATKSANSFEVRELGGGTSNIRFDYRITAIRRNYETVRFEDHTNDPDTRKMLAQMRKTKPASSSDVKPTSPTRAGVPIAQLANK